MDFQTLKAQDDRTSAAVLELLKGDSTFHLLSAEEGKLIVTRDAEDEEKLAVGIEIAVKRGILPAEPMIDPPTRIPVAGKSADEVAADVLRRLQGDRDGHTGKVVVLQGLSGTGKGTTVSKLRASLPRCVCWSNGNVFRSLTYLLLEHLSANKIEFTPQALTPELIHTTMTRLSFEKFEDEFDVVIDGSTRVGTICNTVLKTPEISSRVPTVAEQTQGEVVRFAADAVKTLTNAGHNVILEGRAQTLNYIPTPFRFELVMDDQSLLGERRAAQRVMAEALRHVDERATESDVLVALKKAVQRFTAPTSP